MNISQVIGWKFNNQAGMKCQEIDGVMEIVEFPLGIPSKADQTLWTAEYVAWEAAGGNKDSQVNREFSDAIRILVETLVPMIQDGSITTATPDDIIIQAKETRKLEL